MAAVFEDGCYVLQHEDGRDIILPNGLNTTSIIEDDTIQYVSVNESFGYKGYPSRMTKSGSGTRFDRNESNLDKLRRIVGLIEATLLIEVKILSINFLYEVNEI